MKRIITVFLLCAMLVALGCGCASNSGETVTVQSVSMITGTGSVGIVDRYAGKVVSGETAEIQKDDEKTILEVFVEVGDMVEAGDVLFSYDTEALQLALDKLLLEKESYENTIAAAKSEIEELEKQRAEAPSSQQLSYTLQINSREADIREAEYNLALKDREVEAMEGDMDHTDITTPISGRVMSVQNEETSDPYGEPTGDSFITVMDVSSYRVEGHINELNLYSLPEGTPVLIRSRIDDTRTWTGAVASIDWENPVTNNQNGGMVYVGGGEDEMTTVTKYPFHITLNSTDGLILGQHVYIEPDYGQEAATGLMLPSWYIMDIDTTPWVWAAGSNDKLEKRPVTLGIYDDMMDQYEILSGITVRDSLAFPEEGLSAGMAVSYFDEDSFGEETMTEEVGEMAVSEPFMAMEG